MRKAISLFGTFFILSAVAPAFGAEKPATLHYFYSDGCERCANTRSRVMPVIEEKFGGALKVDYRNIGDPGEYLMLFNMKREYSADEESVFPVLALNGRFTDGRHPENLTLGSIEKFVTGALGTHAAPLSGSTGGGSSAALQYFNRIGPLAIMAAGLADGINPCSFTVIVFFISFLYMRGYARKEIAIVGAVFILAVFTTYLCLGAGLLGSIRGIDGFWHVSAVLNTVIGVLSIGLGVVSAYDAVKYIRTGSTDSMVLQLPKRIKDSIHRVIGDQYRDRKASATLAGLAVGTFGAGVLVSLFESVCTGQLYIPTIMFVLKTTQYKIAAISKLVAYNVMFVAPLFLVYLLALAGMKSEAFGGFMKKHMVLIKIAMAVLFIALGASLVHAEERKASSSAPVAFDQKAWPTRNDPNYHDFGTVKEGTVLKRRFYIENKESEPLGITKVNTSCACTATKLDADVVQPGKKVPIEIQFDTKGYPGERVRYIYAHTDSAKTPIIIFEIHVFVEQLKTDPVRK